jgi:hypothetical protein
LFIRTGKEAGGAYRDTLGDLTLGTLGALLGSAAVALIVASRSRRRFAR